MSRYKVIIKEEAQVVNLKADGVAKSQTYEEALARFKRSLENKRNAEKQNPLLETIIADFESTAQALTAGKP